MKTDVKENSLTDELKSNTSSLIQIPETMRAIYQIGYGEFNQILKLTDSAPIPKIQSHELLIKIEYCSITPADYKIALGNISMVLKKSFPNIPGFDGTGKVVQIGDKVLENYDSIGWKPNIGDLVWFDTGVRQGSMAQYVAIPANFATPLPNNITLAEASTLPVGGLCSYLSLVQHGKLQKGQRVLILGGSSGTAVPAIQIAKSIGAYVATTTSTRNIQLVKDLGADLVIDYTKEQFVNIVKEENDKFDLIYDCVGGIQNWIDGQRILKENGKYVSIAGDKVGKQVKVTLGYVFSMVLSVINRKFWSYFGKKIDYIPVYFDIYDNHHLFELKKLVETKQLKAVVDKQYEMNQFIQLFEGCAEGRTRGRSVMKIDHSPLKTKS